MRDRKSNRLKGYDYSQTGYYFVTVCTMNREEWFGKVGNQGTILNEYGEIARRCWTEIPGHFEDVGIDEFVIMPNHVHGIVTIQRDLVGNAYMRSLQNRTKMLLPVAIQQYKSSVTRRINSLQNNFSFRWQESFYDHVIRSEKSLDLIREYIQNNPAKWDLDRENPLSQNFNLDHDHYWEEIMIRPGRERFETVPYKNHESEAKQ